MLGWLLFWWPNVLYLRLWEIAFRVLFYTFLSGSWTADGLVKSVKCSLAVSESWH